VGEHSQQGVVKVENHLGGSTKQIRMASDCGPIRQLGCQYSQGQGPLNTLGSSRVFKRGPGRPYTNCGGLLRMGITGKEAEVAALNRSDWYRNRSVAQCIHLDAG